MPQSGLLVFPARAGMSRELSRDYLFSRVFPARAGMSREGATDSDCFVGVPRASGDEPRYVVPKGQITVCSPRERG